MGAEHCTKFCSNKENQRKKTRPRGAPSAVPIYVRDETQPTSCGLCIKTNSYVKIVKFLRSRFFVYLVYKKYFIDPSAKIVDDHDIRRPRTARQMYYWSSKCPFYLALLLGCLPMCLLCRSGRGKATDNAAKQGIQKSIFCILLSRDYG